MFFDFRKFFSNLFSLSKKVENDLSTHISLFLLIYFFNFSFHVFIFPIFSSFDSVPSLIFFLFFALVFSSLFFFDSSIFPLTQLTDHLLEMTAASPSLRRKKNQ